ncbi:hypothetical protein OEA41_004981 [Lepraria neglecta]|uniref:Amine oxidase domain-containing protein n=1 Tax=Lepraria neglecta TaxID=209136 RepID=A0AAD9Z2X5_9LECA|nr:hypothetical protein OEA41_004981 [Lepraria neglecta]
MECVRDSIAKLLTRLNKEDKLSKLPGFENFTPPSDGEFKPDELPPRPEDKSQDLPAGTKVCIVGAGISGLYAALILDHLEVPYDILEAADRPGGRILTHYFSTRKHDYYDIGAMRFPKVPPMERTYDLFKRTKVPLIDYHLSGKNTPKSYNGITVYPNEAGDFPTKGDPFRVSESNGGSVPDDRIDTISTVMEDAFRPLREALKEGDAESFKLFEKFDDLTVREYLSQEMGLDFHTIQWLEETDSATGLFDTAFTEAVMDSIAFDYSEEEEEEWKSVEGGTNLVTQAVIDMIKTKPRYNKRVTRMAFDRKAKSEEMMVVTTNYDEEPRRYATIINTTTLACLQRVDTTDLELSSTVKIAMRTLHYDSSTKVAIKFDNPWWISKFGITEGGVANTDLPIRVCVYPSYNIHDKLDEPAVLLCTYTWSQDATRIGSLVNLDSPRGEDELKGLLLYNLARLHSTGSSFEEVYAMIKGSYITHHGFDWAMDDFSSGAFALFGPGQFRSLYPHLVRPAADSRFHIVGEASSANHAWIVGSIESAYRGVWNFLERFKAYDLQQKMIEEWGTVPELETGKDGFAHLLVALGMLTPEQLAKGEKEVVRGVTS